MTTAKKLYPRDSCPRIGQGQALCGWIWVLVSMSQIKVWSINHKNFTGVVIWLLQEGLSKKLQKDWIGSSTKRVTGMPGE